MSLRKQKGISMRIQKEIMILYKRALILISENNLEMALEWLNNALHLNPKEINIWELLSKVYLKKGEYNKAGFCQFKVKELKKEKIRKSALNQLYS